jgi:NADH-ubiquinone oxidoreductase chain 5
VNIYGASSFVGSIWFMPFFSTYGVSLRPLAVGYRATRVFDSGWMEYFGGQGLYCVLFNLGRLNQWFQYNSLKLFLGFFVMWVVILLFILIYYVNSLWFRARRWRCRWGVCTFKCYL